VGGGPSDPVLHERAGQAGISDLAVERKARDNAKPCGGAHSLCMVDESIFPRSIIDRKVATMRMISPFQSRG